MQMETNPTPAASAALLPPFGADAGDRPRNQAGDGGAPASHFAGTSSTVLANAPGPTGGAVSSANASTIFGPLTSHDMTAAGGPFNKWDCDIAAARRRGNHQLAKRLQEARARINIAFGRLEPVWVPSDSQRAMLRLRKGAAVDGVATMKAVA